MTATVDPAPPPVPPTVEAPQRSMREAFRSYIAIDTRVLGAFRILMGFLLLAELVNRMHGANFRAFYTDEGLVPVDGWRSLHKLGPTLFAFTTSPTSAGGLVAAIAVVYVLYTAGFASRLMQVLVAILYVSLDNRNPVAASGGTSVVHSLLLWTLFLPLGERFSIDALRRTRPARETVSSVATLGVYVNTAIIYAFSAFDKTGPSWADGTALHFAIWANEYCTSFGNFVRLHEPGFFSPIFSAGTLLIEWSLPFLILTPWRWQTTRAIAFPIIVIFHFSIALMMNVGCFTFGMPLFGLLVSGPWLTAQVVRVLRRTWAKLPLGSRFPLGEPWLAPEEPSPRARLLGRAQNVLAGVTLVAIVAAASNQNKPVPKDFRLTQLGRLTKWIPDGFAIHEGWGMFAPEPRRREEVFVVDAQLADGSHVDPLTGNPPDLREPMNGPTFDDISWRHWRRGLVHRKELAPWVTRWILAYAEREHLPETKRVVSFTGYAALSDQPKAFRTVRTHFRTETLYSWPPGGGEPVTPTPSAPSGEPKEEPGETSF